MRAGKLRKRVTIQTKTLTANDYGELAASWTTAPAVTVWGEMTPLLTETREKFAAQGAQIQARVSWQCRLRWCVLSPATNRLVMDGTVYEVSGVMDPDGRRHELVALCWEVQD